MKRWLWLGLLCLLSFGPVQGWAEANDQCASLFNQMQYSEAFPVCIQSAEQGDALSQYYLGSSYNYGLGVRQDDTEAVKWYLMAAEQGHAGAQYCLGVRYNDGRGVKQDYVEALKWYLKAAEQGHARAQYNLGWMYDSGQGAKQDYAEAVKWYLLAAEQGVADTYYNLGLMYGKGLGVKQDYAEALKWYLMAADQGDDRAQYNLGAMYGNGQGVKQDDSEALKWFRKAAEHGHAVAQYNLGGIYGKGLGVQQDDSEALKWYLMAAEQGDVNAQYRLGMMYHSGQGVKQVYAKAVMWYLKAAEQGDARAQFNLGVMSSTGKGAMKSGATAADWYYKSGLSYLKENNRAGALQSVERIQGLQPILHLTVPNAFLADKLLAVIYGGTAESDAPQEKEDNNVGASFGTGWPVAGGFVVTNHHVVAGYELILLMRRDGVKIPGDVVMDDAINDLVLIRVADVSKLPPALPLATRAAHAGARVFTLGYPHPDLMGSEPKITDGIISSLTGIGNDPRTYQISVPLQGGNSGGPLLNMNGEVVGVTTSKMRAVEMFKWSGDLPQNVNYAVKSGYLSMLLSSVSSKNDISILPVKAGNIEELAARIEKSVLMVIAE